LLDALIEERQGSAQPLARASSGSTTFSFAPDPNQTFNRAFTDYFVQGRQQDIGAFDSPKNPGQPIAFVTQVGPNWVELELTDRTMALHNGDGLCYYDLQKELVGLAINRAEAISAAKGRWRVCPKDAVDGLKDLRKGLEVNRNRDVDWVRALDKKSSDRRIGVWATLSTTPDGITLSYTDEDGCMGEAQTALPHEPAKDPTTADASNFAQIEKLGATIFVAISVDLTRASGLFVPASVLNTLRRAATQALETSRAQTWQRLPRATPVEPPVPYPHDSLSYLANVHNQAARAFYARHGVKVIDAAYEDNQELGEVSLMITKHCVRFSLSLCPKQAKGVVGVQGQVRAEPLQLVNGKEKLTLRFDCKPCEMHVMGKMKTSVRNQQSQALEGAVAAVPITFHKVRPLH
jgi:putative protease